MGPPSQGKTLPFWYYFPQHLTIKQPSPTVDWYGVWQYDQRMLETVANAISTLLASLLPSISILVLYFLSKPVTRLVAILLFSVLFSVILSAVSTGRRIEVFAATTAWVMCFSSCWPLRILIFTFFVKLGCRASSVRIWSRLLFLLDEILSRLEGTSNN